MEQCIYCYYCGGCIGFSFQGYCEFGGVGQDLDKVGYFGKVIYGYDVNYYIIDEDFINSYDEILFDVYFQVGMDCVDCYIDYDVYGDGYIYVNIEIFVEIWCEDCYGIVEVWSIMIIFKGNVFK